MNDNDITAVALSGDTHVIPSDAASAVGNGTSGDSAATVAELSLAEINQGLGKNFPDKETAIKAIKDTFSYVGKKKDDAVAEARASLQTNDSVDKLSNELVAIRKDMFYKDNPQYAPYRSLIEKVPGNPSEIVNLPEFKDVFTKASGFDDSQKLKTVLDSSPRLASSRDALSKAHDLKQAGATNEAIGDLLARAVLDASN